MVRYKVEANLVPDMKVIAEALPHVEKFYDVATKRNKDAC